MQKETEIKLRASRETLLALREHPLLKKRNNVRLNKCVKWRLSTQRKIQQQRFVLLMILLLLLVWLVKHTKTLSQKKTVKLNVVRTRIILAHLRKAVVVVKSNLSVITHINVV